jgi:metallo-beta-lactamase family protein
MILQFLGATQTVTGSMHLVTINGKRILLDCGIYHGHRDEANERNRNFPFDPASLDVVVLSHAHIDHSGNLPGLVKHGFSGPIYSTFATRDLCNIMLLDSAYIQEKDAEFLNRKNRRNHTPPVEPLYSVNDVQKTIQYFHGVGYHREIEITPGVSVTYFDAGHILGSAVTLLNIRENGKTVRLGFSGDLGRPHLPILKDPEPLPQLDVLITESTYGGHFHDPIVDMPQKLLEVISEAISRGGKIIIPSFSVGRTQEIVYTLHTLADEGKLPRFPIFVDSPLSVNVTEVFKLHSECFDEEISRHVLQHDDPFGLSQLTYIQNVEESKKLNTREGPFMVIAASGMCEAGRILHHLANSVGDARNTILIVGYQAENTLGKKIVDRRSPLRILGGEYELNARVIVMNSFSAHADHGELLAYYKNQHSGELKDIFLVHGEPARQEKLKEAFKERGFRNVVLPKHLQKVEW